MADLTTTPLDQLTVEDGPRPEAPKMPEATDEHRRQGRKLAAIHRAHLMDLARIDRTLRRIEAGDAPPEDLADIVLSLEMTQNLRAFGSLCGQECRMLSFHHDAEEHSIFPQLEARGSDALRAVVARLREEHKVVHELIQRLERASMTLMFEPDQTVFEECAAIFRQLEAVVRSHFGYEEVQIEEALGVYLTEI